MRTFWIIAAILLAWNLAGDAAYLSQVSADLDELAKADPITAEAFRSMPAFVWSAYAIAVWIGTAGAVALLLRRKVAWVLFAISLTGVAVQFGWTFLATDLMAQKGIGSVAFPLVIAAIAFASTRYARRKAADGTLR